MTAPPPPADEIRGGGPGPASESELLLDVLFEHARAGLAHWDTDLRYVRVNEQLAEINGLPAEAHVGRTLPEAIGTLGLEVEAMLRRLLETAEPIVGLELAGQTPAQPGVLRHWNASYYPVMADGRVTGILGAVVEVTAEREAVAREQLALSEARTASAMLDALVEAAPVGIGFWNRDLRYERVNSALAELNGAAPEDHIGRTPSDVTGDMGLRVMSALRRAVETRRPVSTQLSGTVAARPGRVQHREGSWFPIFDAAGEVAGVGGVVRDVTHRHEAEAERNRLLSEALASQAAAEDARVRADRAREEAEQARADAESARGDAEAAHARTRILVEASARMAASMDYDESLERLARTLVPQIADVCLITTVEAGEALRARTIVHRDPETTELARRLLAEHPPRRDAPHGTGRVIRTGEAELIQELTDELLDGYAGGGALLEVARTLGLRTVLSVPLKAGGQTLGALSLAHAGSGRRFSEDLVVLARALAERAALHIRNAQLYTERSHVAQTLQASLLPKRLPEIPNAEIAARYRPAGMAMQVGGDFYDVFPSGAGVWTALLGDVAGKGAEAAAVTSLARHTLRAAALHSKDPARNLETLNRALLAEVDTTRFCTVLYGNLFPREDGCLTIRLANGGHLSPRIVRAGGGVERVAVEGTLVGAIEEASFEVAEVVLAPGDAVFMFTDGVTEVRGRRADYGELNLDALLAELTGEPAERIVATVLDWAMEMHEHAPRDDMALLAMRAAS